MNVQNWLLRSSLVLGFLASFGGTAQAAEKVGTIRFTVPSGWRVQSRTADTIQMMATSGGGAYLNVLRHPGFGAAAAYTPEGVADYVRQLSFPSATTRRITIGGTRKYPAVQLSGGGVVMALFDDSGQVYMVSTNGRAGGGYDELLRSIDLGDGGPARPQPTPPRPAPAPRVEPKNPALPIAGDRPPRASLPESRPVDMEKSFREAGEAIAELFGGLPRQSPSPDFSSSFYRESNPVWQRGFAPKSQSPPHTELGNAKGNCTWYVHGRLRELGFDSNALNVLRGHADEYSEVALKHPNYFTVNNAPKPGAIAQWKNGYGDHGHVAVVERVNSDGTILLSESSYAPGDPVWDFLYHPRPLNADQVERFIHVPR
jgi:hypothetical protein